MVSFNLAVGWWQCVDVWLPWEGELWCFGFAASEQATPVGGDRWQREAVFGPLSRPCASSGRTLRYHGAR